MKLRPKHRFHISIVSFLCVGTLAASLCSCGKKETQDYAFVGTNGDASSLGVISVQVREDGSGTRNQFESYLGIQMSENEADKYKDMEQCTISTSGSALASAVNDAKNAIGYVSYGQMQGDSKALAIDGIVCTRESIADHAYPLTRDFTLAWVESPNALRDDFVKYIAGAGQKIVGQTYVPVAEETSFLADPDAKGTLNIRGSSSMADLLTALADAYMTVNKNAEIHVYATDSTKGLNDAMEGKCDMAMVSRSLKDYERDLVESTVIATDGIAVIVQKDNPINQVSKDELKGIFNGNITSWNDIQ